MNRKTLESALRQTLEDRRLSRSERRALAEVLADERPGEEDLAWLRSQAFDLARQELFGHENHLVLDWLEEVVKVLGGVDSARPASSIAEAWFTPDDDAAGRIIELLRSARRSVDVCVFTITDDRLTRALVEAHRRGVALRIITDDEKSFDRGSDVDRLAEAGVQVRTDRSAFHMHNKFAVVDGQTLLTGSYNWTRGAADDNEENFLITDDARLVAAYSRAFAGLWQRFGA